MWISSIELPFQGRGEFTLAPIGDLQIRAGKASERRWVVSEIEKLCKIPNLIPVILGDIEDDDRPSTRAIKDSAFAARREVLIEQTAAIIPWIDDVVIPILVPLVEASIAFGGILAGHHFKWLLIQEGGKEYRISSAQYIAERLEKITGKKVPYLGIMSAWIELKFKNRKDKGGLRKLVHVQHGAGGGGTMASSIRNLERTQQGFVGDAYIRAHDCKLIGWKSVVKEPYGSAQDPKIRSKIIPMLNIGSATEGYRMTQGAPDYPEMAMMRPLARGWGRLKATVRRALRREDKNENFFVDWSIEL